MAKQLPNRGNNKAHIAYARKQKEADRIRDFNKINISKHKASLANAKKIINEVKRSRSKILDLSFTGQNTKLYEIPSEVFELEHLEELNLFNNGLRVIPGGIRKLKNLKKLNIALNPISQLSKSYGLLTLDWNTYEDFKDKIPSENVEGVWLDSNNINNSDNINITINNIELLFDIHKRHDYTYEKLLNLKNLTSITAVDRNFLSGNNAESIDERLTNVLNNIHLFKGLKSVSIYGIKLVNIPVGIRLLPSISSLYFIDTFIEEIPTWIGELQSLTRLNISSNKIKSIPESLGDLANLEYLSLANNYIDKIPPQIFRLKKLTYLDLHLSDVQKESVRNYIKEIPSEILQLENLQGLNINGQPIETPPLEVAAVGLDSIKNYWRQNLESGMDYLCEAKLIIVGEAGAGKTTLTQKIIDSEYVLKPQELSTEGIDVVKWNFPTVVRIKKNEQEEFFQTNFKAGIWDFGGQEIYHATHQFFLTRRSLYILVVDNRKEDTDFNYWLQIVNLLSDGSPLMIVQNEKQDRQRSIDLGSLRAQFPNLKEVFRTNLDTNRGLDDFKKVIQHELERLPHIGSPLLKTWTQVRVALENDYRNHISLEEYFSICQKNGFLRKEDKLQLGRYLHDIGICLYFQDDPILKNIVILKPKWGTDAVYKILDDQTILDNKGSFDFNDLSKLWSEDEYSSMHDELLHLMIRFKLCYKLNHSEKYIAPQMLSPERPNYTWITSKQLVMRYEYEFMPKGIIAKFIVALNHLIKDQKLVWKSGVVLNRKNT
ncbi:MAG: GTPase, partial [Sphingobacteriaceae bacterium]